jgi:hypothetical protein
MRWWDLGKRGKRNRKKMGRDDMKKTNTQKTGQEGTIDQNKKERSIVLRS